MSEPADDRDGGDYDRIEEYRSVVYREWASADWAEADEAFLAQELHDRGLIYVINRLVLYPLGLALGVNLAADTFIEELVDGEVRTLTLWSTRNRTGMRYTDAQIERNEAKLEKAFGPHGHAIITAAIGRFEHVQAVAADLLTELEP